MDIHRYITLNVMTGSDLQCAIILVHKFDRVLDLGNREQDSKIQCNLWPILCNLIRSNWQKTDLLMADVNCCNNMVRATSVMKNLC